MEREAYICDYIRSPIGRYAGALSKVRSDDLAGFILKSLLAKSAQLDPSAIDEVILGCANQAGEDNRNVARMAVLLSNLPMSIPATTINRLCGSGMDAIIMASRAIKTGEAEIIVAGGVESMSRAPFILPKADSAFSRSHQIYDSTIGWRFVNPAIEAQYGIDSMPETAENVASQFEISRQDQDQFAYHSQVKAKKAQENGRLALEIAPFPIEQKEGSFQYVDQDEHLRLSSVADLAKLKTPFRKNGSVTAGNASGVNDGAAALLIASKDAIKRYNLTPIAKILGGATIGVEPRIMGIGPLPASQKLLTRLGLSINQMDVIELNEAFASQSLAVMRGLGLDDDDQRVNPNGGAIALGHPLGMSGARITGSAAMELQIHHGHRYALATMCIGVGQGIAIILEKATQ